MRSSMQPPKFGSRIKDKKRRLLMSGLGDWIVPGEQVRLIVRTNRLRPMLDYVAVTNARVLGIQSTVLPPSGPTLVVQGDAIASLQIRKTILGPNCLVLVKGSEEVMFGNLDKPDVADVVSAVSDLRRHEMPDSVLQRTQTESRADPGPQTILDGAVLVGHRVSDKAARAIAQHTDEGESPWLVVGSGVRGVLAAFEDRLLILKVGAMTSMMADSFGGGQGHCDSFR
jgi:hypothetical protein